MGLFVPLITFTPATVVASADVNTNFASINTAPNFTGGVPLMNFDSGKLISDGQGNIQLNNGIGMNARRDIIDWSSSTDTYIKATSSNGALYFQIGAPSAGNPIVNILAITKNGISINPNSLLNLDSGIVFQTGSLSRSSTFTGTGSGVYNHKNNGTPSMICPCVNSGGNGAAIGFSSLTPNQCYISEEFSNPFQAWVVAF